MDSNWYNAFIHTSHGHVVSLIDWVSDAAYRNPKQLTLGVYPIGVNDPSEHSQILVKNPADPIASPFGWHRLSRRDKENPETTGNNVDARENRKGSTKENIIHHRPFSKNQVFDAVTEF